MPNFAGTWTLTTQAQAKSAGLWPSVPAAPTIGTATATTATTATVAFTAGATGYPATVTYTATSSPGGLTGTGTSPITVTGLSATTSYTFTVTAANATGTSAASAASNSITTPANVTYLVADMYNAAGSNANALWASKTDSAGNIYVSGQQKYTGVTIDYYVAKLTSAGVMTWQRTLNSGGESDYARSMTVDSSGNVYVAGFQNSVAQTVLVTKWDSSGTLLWQRALGDGNAQFIGWAIGVDSSNNVFVGAFAQGASFPANNYAVIMKLDGSTGAKLAQRYFRVGSEINGPQLHLRGLTIDSSNNVIISGFYYDGSVTSTALVAKYDNTLATQAWNLRMSGLSNNILQHGQDSSGNIYASGGSDSKFYIIKTNSAGAVQWQKALAYAPTSVSGFTTAVHPASGNVYGVANTNYENGTIVFKLDSSGALQWGRRLIRAADGNGPTAYSISVTADGAAIILAGFYDAAATSGGPQNASIWVFPSDGTKTGTYTVNGRSVIWSAITLTASTPTLTAGTYTFNDPGGTWVSNTISLTNSAGGLTSAVTIIP
jgi:hypothetical protein